MPPASDITPLVLTYNEMANIDRTLSRLTWAHCVVVVDSGSTDETVAICARYPQVKLVQRAFDDHTSQWNFGLSQVDTPWVLSLDADYVLSDQLMAEVTSGAVREDVVGYFAKFTYCVFGRPLRGSLYPPRIVLFRRDQCRYVQDGHTQRLEVTGEAGWLAGRVLHDDRKTIDRWLADQIRYSMQEAKHLTEMPRSSLNRADWIRRRTPAAPLLVMAYALVYQRLLLDGWPGWYYALQRGLAELLLLLRLWDRDLRSAVSNRNAASAR